MNKKENDFNFEQSMEELEKIANELENGKLTLDESVEKFEQGMILSKKCNELLNNAEKKITILINNDEDNKLKEENFELKKEDE